MYVRRCAHGHLSLFLYCGGFLNPVSLTQRDEAQRIEVQYTVSVSGFFVTFFTPHSILRVGHLYVVRLEAVL